MTTTDERLDALEQQMARSAEYLGSLSERQARAEELWAQLDRQSGERHARLAENMALLDAATSTLAMRVTELVARDIMMSERFETTRASLLQSMEMLERYFGQTTERLVDHAGDPDAHQDQEDH